MNALLQPIAVRPLKRPSYKRWDLLRARDEDAWIRENRELLQGWFNDLSQHGEMDCEFMTFAQIQFDIEYSHFEDLRADAQLDHDYVDLEE